MCAWIVPPVPGLIEPSPAPVIWVEAIGAVAVTGDWISTYYYRTAESLHGGDAAKVVELVKMMPVSAVANAIVSGGMVLNSERRNWPQQPLPPVAGPKGLAPKGFRPHIVRP